MINLSSSQFFAVLTRDGLPHRLRAEKIMTSYK
jgi:hypothetical protein